MYNTDYEALSKIGKQIYNRTYKFEREANAEEHSTAHLLAIEAARCFENKAFKRKSSKPNLPKQTNTEIKK